MKRIVTVVILTGLLVATPLVAQSQFVAPAPTPRPTVPGIPKHETGFQGVVVDIFRMKKPWELINPFAPTEYGNGSKNTTKDPNDPSIPKGIILFGITW